MMNFTKYSISIILFLILNNSSNAQDAEQKQERSNFSFGLTFGYKTDGGNFTLQFGYLIKKIVDLNVHLGANKYEGGAFGAGLKGFILPKSRFKPYVGITYDYFNSHQNGFTVQTDTLTSTYRRSINTELLWQIGLLYEEQPLSIFASLNYKTTFPGNRLILFDGPHNQPTEDAANRVYAPGLGVTVGIIFHWWGKKQAAFVPTHY